MTDKLKPCPFCEIDDVELEHSPHRYWVVCNDCLASGPTGLSEDEAIEAWNTRVTL